MDSVSILIPVYKVEQFIERCARSVFNQDYENLDIVFVDDCSPDNSISLLTNVIKEFPNRTSQLRIIRHDKNRGLSAARNTAVSHARGEFLIHVDSDDYLAPDAISKLVANQRKTNSDIVTGNAWKITRKGCLSMKRTSPPTKKEFVFSQMNMDMNHTIWGRLIRRNLYVSNNIHAVEGVNMGEDWQTMPQLAYYAESYSNLDDYIYYYDCTNQNSYMYSLDGLFHKSNLDQQMESVNIFCRFFEDKETDFYDYAKRIKIRMLYYTAMNGLAHRQKEFYYDYIKRLNEFDCTYWKIINWDSTLKRIIDRNYYLKLFYNGCINFKNKYVTIWLKKKN